MKVEIKPFEGIGEVKFGMSQAAVKELMDEAARIEIDNVLEETREQRMGMTFRYIGDELKDIVISKYVEAFIFDLPIYETDDLIGRLSEFAAPTKETAGYVNFYDLGLSLGGFGKRKIPEGKVAICFAADRVQFYKYFLEV